MNPDQERQLAARLLDREPDAAAELEAFRGDIERVLVARGATATEAGDLVADLIARCMGERERSPLRHFKGAGNLKGFLIRAALNMLIDLKRQQATRKTTPASELARDGEADAFDHIADGEGDEPDEDTVVDLLRECLANAYEECDPEMLLMMRLVQEHGINQRQLTGAWGWHESKISRGLGAAMEQLRDKTMDAVREADPWLDIEWGDFVDLCRGSNELFSKAS